jgi:hypothetical protein
MKLVIERSLYYDARSEKHQTIIIGKNNQFIVSPIRIIS